MQYHLLRNGCKADGVALHATARYEVKITYIQILVKFFAINEDLNLTWHKQKHSGLGNNQNVTELYDLLLLETSSSATLPLLREEVIMLKYTMATTSDII